MATTTKGMNVDLNSYVSVQNAHRNFDLYSPDEFVALRYWAKLNDGVGNLGTLKDMNTKVVLDDQIMFDSYTSRNFVNWEDLMIKNALQNDNNVSIRGGTPAPGCSGLPRPPPLGGAAAPAPRPPISVTYWRPSTDHVIGGPIPLR